MKLEIAAQADHKTNNTGMVTRSFTIGNVDMVIDILRNKLYSNPIQTLVQEYVSNARDAHREIGQTRPIKITEPTETDLTLKIRDYGPGLSPERIDAVFCRYGDSTKRKDNNQVGGFGIGAKSAWAYTDSFTIVTHIDSQAYHYVAHVTRDHAGSLDLISQNPTTEPNGTEIQIVCRSYDLEAFKKAIARATRFWSPSELPVIENQSFSVAKTLFRSDSVECVEITGLPDSERLQVVVDGIPYPIPAELRYGNDKVRALHNKTKVLTLLHFATGEIEIAASREAVGNSDSNRLKIISRAESAAKDIDTEINNRIAGKKSLIDVLSEIAELKNVFISSDQHQATFQGDSFGITFGGKISSPVFESLLCKEYSFRKNRRGVLTDKVRIEDVGIASINFLSDNIYYQDEELSTRQLTQRMKPLVKKTNSTAYLITGSPERIDVLTKHLKLKPVSDLQTEKRVSLKRNSNQIVAGIAFEGRKFEIRSKIIDLRSITKKHAYVVRGEPEEKNAKFLNGICCDLDIGFFVLSEREAERIQGNSNFVKMKDILVCPKEVLDPDQINRIIVSIRTYKYGTPTREVERKLLAHYTPVEDQNLISAIRDAMVEEGDWGHGVKFAEILSFASLPEIHEFKNVVERLAEERKKYPLLEQTKSLECVDDLVFYLNAKYRSSHE